jgi:transposase InsO family protein
MLEPAKDATGESAAHFLLKIAGMFGRPKGIRTDGGSQYDNHLLDVFCELLGMQRHVTLAYRPQANGRVERVCKEVGRHLRFICLDRRIEGQWSVMLPIVQRVLNTTPHIALGVEPAKIVFGGFQTTQSWPAGIPERELLEPWYWRCACKSHARGPRRR